MDASGGFSTSPHDRGEQVDQQQTNQRAEQKTTPGVEVFCGRIPPQMSEEEVRAWFVVYGPMNDMRMKTDPVTNLNEGTAFISFLHETDALRAVAELNGWRVGRGQFLKVARCLPNTRLYVGNIPKVKSKDYLHEEFALLTAGLKEVIIYKYPGDYRRNRGFCFLEYESHEAAAAAKEILSAEDLKVWGCNLGVDWADAQQEVDSDTMARVRIIYARNISAAVSEDALWDLFAPFGHLERVRKLKDFAFIHFASRRNANAAIQALNGYELEGEQIELQWAKPRTDKESRQEMLRERERRLVAEQSSRPVRGAVNPFPQPWGWYNDDQYFYDSRGGGDQDQRQLWSPHEHESEDYFWPTSSGDAGFQDDLFDDQFPYPVPRIPRSAFSLSGEEETFSGPIPPRSTIPQGPTNGNTSPQDWSTNVNSVTQRSGDAVSEQSLATRESGQMD